MSKGNQGRLRRDVASAESKGDSQENEEFEKIQDDEAEIGPVDEDNDFDDKDMNNDLHIIDNLEGA